MHYVCPYRFLRCVQSQQQSLKVVLAIPRNGVIFEGSAVLGYEARQHEYLLTIARIDPELMVSQFPMKMVAEVEGAG